MNWHWILYCISNPRTVDPEIVFVVVKYLIYFHVAMYVTFRFVSEDDWLEKFCDNNRDAEHYQLSSPP